MTDRYHSLTVVLAHDMRDDDAEPLMEAIRMLKGVLSVAGHVSNLTTHTAEERARAALIEQLWAVLVPKRSV